MPPVSQAKQQLTETRKALLAALPVGVDEALEALEHVGETTTFAAWRDQLVQLTLEEAQEAGATDAPCPLCHGLPASSSDKQYGYSLPRGLYLHLTSGGRGDPCVVAQVLADWAKEIETFNAERVSTDGQPKQRRRRRGAAGQGEQGEAATVDMEV